MSLLPFSRPTARAVFPLQREHRLCRQASAARCSGRQPASSDSVFRLHGIRVWRSRSEGLLFSFRSIRKGDLLDIDYPDQYFDIATCNHILKHVPDDLTTTLGTRIATLTVSRNRSGTALTRLFSFIDYPMYPNAHYGGERVTGR
jgi:hypothetical protein